MVWSGTVNAHVVVIKNRRVGKFFIDWDNYLNPHENVVQQFDSIEEAKEAYPNAICLIKQRRYCS